MPSERNQIAREALEASDRLTKIANDLTWGCEDKRQLERKAQSDRAFSNILKSLNNRRA